ncbi:flavin oxidoreductase [Stenotrophobium rhamnosiphilum]|uniref:Flavin oxidoreductase n=2 Tax=Stenotrophobium rhamnosiphilum TaxID=2029166 RepID=A0A2T5MJ23_9GAMM|nr:NADH:flavin oxidoreductase [Stenotrophobium rhamnosiphilum]PTU32558.1 flavin oxidoreductase [Stenotrophobium rhamnosiphilum]
MDILNSTQSSEFSRALMPWALGPIRLRNRVIKSATNEGMAPRGVPTKALVQHHRSMAAGGVGMTTVAYCSVSADGRTFPDQITLNAETVKHLRVLTDAVHREGAAASAQITHGGAFNFLPQLSTRYPMSASSGFNAAGVLNGRWFKNAMTRDDMARIKQEFVSAALVAQQSGFDAIELHMGHGYLLSQFLSPKYNRRKDTFGGSAEARVRFPAEVLNAVLDAVGKTMPVICKISMFEGYKGGGTVEDAVVAAKSLSAHGAHLIVLSAGANVEAPWAIFGSQIPKGVAGATQSFMMRAATQVLQWQQPKIEFHDLYLLEAARRIRAVVDTPLAYLGGVKSIAGIEEAMRDGFEAIVMGRALIHQPDLLRGFEAGKKTRSGCTACNLCVPMMYTPGGTRCALTSVENSALNQLAACD